MNDNQEIQEVVNEGQELRPLPEGSTAIQCVLEQGPNGPEIVINGVIIGGGEYDVRNPCHRFLTAIADRLPEIMAEVGGQDMTLEKLELVAANDDAATSAATAG